MRNLALFLLFVGVALFYPAINAKSGTDGDDALKTAATRLIQGKYPYSEKTFLGNPITPLPGLVILAIPVLLIGVQFFSPLMLLTLKNRAILLILMVLGARTILIGSDYLANGILMYWGVKLCEDC